MVAVVDLSLGADAFASASVVVVAVVVEQMLKVAEIDYYSLECYCPVLLVVHVN